MIIVLIVKIPCSISLLSVMAVVFHTKAKSSIFTVLRVFLGAHTKLPIQTIINPCLDFVVADSSCVNLTTNYRKGCFGKM